MKRFVRYGWLVAGLCVGTIVVGCASSYFKVTDPQSGKEYYTQEISNEKGGAVKLKDARSGSIITLQNSEVKEIKSDEYKAGLAAPMSKPTPVPAAAVPAPVTAPATAPAAAPAPAAVEAAPAPAAPEPASVPATAEPSPVPSVSQ